MKRRAPLAAAVLAVTLGGCNPYQPFDSAAHLREQYAASLGAANASSVTVPFELGPAVVSEIEKHLQPLPSQQRRINQILDYIFSALDLRYALQPTRDADEVFRTHEGNCLSFVNLFVGIARHEQLAPFYVEVVDYQRWNRREGMVVSQGHIVAGMYVEGELKTYDFLPYRPKAYRNFKPIDDLTAAAHYFNNLGAEALLAGDVENARKNLRIAAGIAPAFEKALNNLGVLESRGGHYEEALALYRKGLESDPDNSLILTNLARVYQLTGRKAEADEILAKVDQVNTTNPFFFVYEAETALAQGNEQKALDYLTKALRQDTEVPEVHVAFVKVYVAIGDLEKARHYLERALKLDATNPEAQAFARLLAEKSR
ncbi:MAG TPA: tetratricopeptide repeat protein [Thermoanaerobaculia bacterium]|nr:tetratricopeptide repeat protein [Thermoanaerobaculia bacterium]